MVDITNKYNTLRQAKAQSIITFGNKKVIELIKENKIPKGDVLEMSKSAGLFAVKNTSNSIPDCHPIPIESTSISFELKDSSIEVLVNIITIYNTGVEVEAMHAASIVALTIYDMIIFTGGTGLSDRDNTTSALESLIETRIPGVEEVIRNYGQQRMPYAMLSRSIVGLYKKCLIIGIPGSTNGATQSVESIFPYILHLFKVLDGTKHEKGER